MTREQHEEAQRDADIAAERRLAECYRICAELNKAKQERIEHENQTQR